MTLSSGKWRVHIGDVSEGMEIGDYTMRATATDGAGNKKTGGTGSFTVDSCIT